MRKKTVCALGSGRGLKGIASLAFGITACAPHPASLTGSLQTKGRSGLCELLAPPSVAASSLRIAVTDAIVPGDAPLPRTDAERVIFPLLFTPPSRVTCHGPSRPMPTESADATSQDTATSASSSTGRDAVGMWPATTGRYAVAAAVDTALDLVPRRSMSGPELHVTRITADGGRDALDGLTDVLITTDATTIAYAAARPDLVSIPLPWSHVYVLMQPYAPVQIDRDTARSLENDLAADAVRVEAQAVDDSEWRDVLATCDTAALTRHGAPADTSAPPPASRMSSAGPLVTSIAYAEDDNVARALSERLVALANARDSRITVLAPALTAGAPVRAGGLDSTGLRLALQIGHNVAYVTAVHVTGTCRDLAALTSEAPWVAPDMHRIRETITPLIESRAHAIVRRGRVGVAVDDAGDVFLEFGPTAGS